MRRRARSSRSTRCPTPTPASIPAFGEPVPSDKIDLQLQAGSVDEWAVRLRGRWPFEGPQDLPWGQRWIRLRDPDGLLIAIYMDRRSTDL
jgi:hypothetical protein